MPTYRFNITDGRKLLDPHGLDLPNEEAALRYADQLAEGYGPVSRALNGENATFIEVTDEHGNTIARSKVE
jgi:Domain of unknown function (DUF6894)